MRLTGRATHRERTEMRGNAATVVPHPAWMCRRRVAYLRDSPRLAWVRSVLRVVLFVFLACGLLRCDYLRDLSAGRHRGAFTLTLREVASYDTPGFAFDVEIVGNHAYVADSSALLVLDIENPTSPQEVGRVIVGNMLWNVSLVGNYACVADRLGDLHVIDVSSDTSPRQVGHIWPGTIGSGIVGILAEGSFAYCTTEDGRFCVVDISKPDSLLLVSRLDRSGSGKIWQLAKYGNYVYAVGYMGLYIFDVSVPEAPMEVGGFALGIMDDNYGPYFKAAAVGNLLHFSDGDLRTLDLTNPTSPADAESIGVYGYVYGVAAQDSLVCFANSAHKPEAESLFVLANDMKASVNTRLPGYSIAITGDYIYLATGRQGVKVFHLERQ
jgi:hypothetical protein